uniref:Uncharacterized protein n=1 Tax=Panagrolaimus superbus TaxID=310955 RepID=A0A914YIV4_9BILA
MSFVSNPPPPPTVSPNAYRQASATPSGEFDNRMMPRLGSIDRIGRQPSMDFGFGNSRYERKFSSRAYLDNVSMESRKPVSII